MSAYPTNVQYDAWYYVHTFPSMVLWRSALRTLRASFSAARSKIIFFSADFVGEGPVTAAMGRDRERIVLGRTWYQTR